QADPIHRRLKVSGYHDIREHFQFPLPAGQMACLLTPLQFNEPGRDTLVEVSRARPPARPPVKTPCIRVNEGRYRPERVLTRHDSISPSRWPYRGNVPESFGLN